MKFVHKYSVNLSTILAVTSVVEDITNGFSSLKTALIVAFPSWMIEWPFWWITLMTATVTDRKCVSCSPEFTKSRNSFTINGFAIWNASGCTGGRMVRSKV
eukprot:1168086_1